MRLAIVFFAIFMAGCGRIPQDQIDLLCECFTKAAIEAVRARLERKPKPAPAGCCKECNGTGKVRSGDGLALVDCPCPPNCKCKCAKCEIKK